MLCYIDIDILIIFWINVYNIEATKMRGLTLIFGGMAVLFVVLQG